MEFPSYAKKWINIRTLFSNFYKVKKCNLDGMLEHLGLKFKGRPHSGLDDARNIVTILSQLVTDGCVLKYNAFLPSTHIEEKAKQKL